MAEYAEHCVISKHAEHCLICKHVAQMLADEQDMCD